MKRNTLLKSIALMLFFPLFLSCTSTAAMEIVEKDEGKHLKQKRYFHSQNLEKTLGVTNNADSREEDLSISSTTNSTDDDSEPEETVYTEATKIKTASLLKRSQSISKGLTRKVSRKFSRKDKGTDQKDADKKNGEEKKTESEKQVVFTDPKRRPIQRQRSWGKNPYIVERTSKTPLNPGEGNNPLGLLPSSPLLPILENTIDLSNEVAVTVTQENPQKKKTLRRGQSAQKLDFGQGNDSQRKPQSWKRVSEGSLFERRRTKAVYALNLEGQAEDSYEDLSSRQRLNPQPWKRLYQGINPLQEGLSLYLDKTDQPLEIQPVSPRYQSTSPRLLQGGLSTEGSDSEKFSESSSDEGVEISETYSSQSPRQEQSSFAIQYEKNRGDAPFIRVMDNRFYRPDPRVVVGFGVLGSLVFGAFPPTAMTGVNVNVTGYYFDIPPGGGLSTTLVATFMTTFTFALLQEGYEWGQTIGGAVWSAMKACYSCYTGKKEQEDALSTPLVGGGEYTWEIGYKKSLLYYGVNGFALIAALPEGILPAALLSSVWAKDFSDLIIPFGTCLLVRYTGQAYHANTRILRYLLKDYINQEPDGKFVYMASSLKDEAVENFFYKANLLPEQAIKHKDLVREAIQRSLHNGEENDDMAKGKYAIVNDERDQIKGLSIDEKKYFAVSALMDKPVHPESMNVPKGNCLKVQGQKAIFLIQKPAGFLKIPLKALALVGAGMAIEQGLKIVLQYWQPDSPYWQPDSPWTPQLIKASAGTLISFYAIKELLHMAKAVKEYGAPKASLATVPNFSLAGFGAAVPAGFSALVGVILGFQYVDESESSQKWRVLMVPYAVDAFLSGHSHFKNKLQGFLTAAVTTIPEYIKECAVDYTPQVVKKGAVYIKEGIVNNTPECLKEFMSNPYNAVSEYISLSYQRSWLWKWHHDLDEKVNDDHDAVTNASLYFVTQEEDITNGYYRDEESLGYSGYGEDIEYHVH